MDASSQEVLDLRVYPIVYTFNSLKEMVKKD
jgi:hypothetical protein